LPYETVAAIAIDHEVIDRPHPWSLVAIERPHRRNVGSGRRRYRESRTSLLADVTYGRRPPHSTSRRAGAEHGVYRRLHGTREPLGVR